MSQHDFNIANQTFPSFRADLNNALQAAATISAGATAPTTPYAYQLWFDTTTDTWKVRNSGNTAWISTITTDLATGNVGIGIALPSTPLHISGASDVVSTIESTDRYSHVDFVDSLGSSRITNDGGNLRLRADNANAVAGSYLTLETDGSEAMRIEGSNVGIGLNGASPTGALSIASGTYDATTPLSTADDIVVSGNRSLGMSFITTAAGTSTQTIAFGDSDNTDVGMIRYAHSDNSMQFTVNATERLRILPTGGITFNGETSAAHALNDYEEGTWVPTVEDAGGTTLSATTSGRFTRIGRLVHVNGDISNINTTGGTSSLSFRVTNLPFTIDEDLTHGACYSTSVSFQGGRTQIIARAHTSEYVDFLVSGSGIGYTFVDVGDITSGTADLFFSISYYTNQ